MARITKIFLEAYRSGCLGRLCKEESDLSDVVALNGPRDLVACFSHVLLTAILTGRETADRSLEGINIVEKTADSRGAG
jgi:hypothetical protein